MQACGHGTKAALALMIVLVGSRRKGGVRGRDGGQDARRRVGGPNVCFMGGGRYISTVVVVVAIVVVGVLDAIVGNGEPHAHHYNVFEPYFQVRSMFYFSRISIVSHGPVAREVVSLVAVIVSWSLLIILRVMIGRIRRVPKRRVFGFGRWRSRWRLGSSIIRVTGIGIMKSRTSLRKESGGSRLVEAVLLCLLVVTHVHGRWRRRRRKSSRLPVRVTGIVVLRWKESLVVGRMASGQGRSTHARTARALASTPHEGLVLGRATATRT